jgi:DNA invertase Pin-like site-specific DNA recombinase
VQAFEQHPPADSAMPSAAAAAALGLVKPPEQTTRMVGYVRVSTEEQGRSGLGLEAQEAAIRRAAGERGWQLVAIELDTASGATRKRRPGLATAVERCRSGEAEGLVVAKLDRLSRSLLDFASLVEEAQCGRFALVVLDQDFDLATASGRAMAGMLAVFATFERDLCSERTKAALTAARRRGTRLGRRPLLPEAALEEVVRLDARGLSLRKLAARLNRDGVPAPAGGRWDHAAVRRVLLRAKRAEAP